jgi:hypothetical protein
LNEGNKLATEQFRACSKTREISAWNYEYDAVVATGEQITSGLLAITLQDIAGAKGAYA